MRSTKNCHIFNDNTFELYREKENKTDHTVRLEHGEPLVFGAERDKGIRLNGFQPEVVDLTDGEHTIDDLIVHDQYAEDTTLANFLAQMSDMPDMPHPMGIFRSVPAIHLRRFDDEPDPHCKREHGVMATLRRYLMPARHGLCRRTALYFDALWIDSANKRLVTSIRKYSTSVRSTTQTAV